MSLPINIKLTVPLFLSFSLLAACGGGGFSADNANSGGASANPGNEPSEGMLSLNDKCALYDASGPTVGAKDVGDPDATSVYYEAIGCSAILTSEELQYLVRFDELQRLSLNTNTMTNLNDLPDFPKLTSLDIRHESDPDGVISDTSVSVLTDISEISKYNNLETFIMLGHAISDLQALSELTNLTQVTITQLNPDVQPATITSGAPLQNLTKLETLGISYTKIDNANFLSGLTALKGVSLRLNQINDISGVENLTNITDSIDFGFNKIVDVTPLANLPKNTEINLESNRIADASSLSGWTGTLQLRNNCILPHLFPEGALGNNTANSSGSQVSDCGIFDARDPELMQMGSGSGSDFVEGTLEIAIPSLTDGGKTAITSTLAGPDGTLTDLSAVVTFRSDCIDSDKASVTGPITTRTGIATVEYTANGCSGEDEVTATTSIEGYSFSASSIVDVQPPILGSLEFISSTPSSIGINGVGLNETSVVKFLLKDNQGNPVPNRIVNFSLNTTNGGISIEPSSAVSDVDGYVQTTVQSGSVSTTVRVTATADEIPSIATQSEGLTISTGISDQDSFSMSASILNPEAWNHDNVEVEISVLAADHFNNPVPDGSAVYFTTEGGVVDSECTTINGQCTVSWRSSEPRPVNGRVTVLASMLGEESFVDSTGNGKLDDESDEFTDMPEAFLDKNEDGLFTPGEDELRDFNNNGQWDDKDGEYNGVLCSSTNTVNICSAEKNIYVNKSLVLIMSSAPPHDNIIVTGEPLDASAGVERTILTVSDVNNQPVPAGTSIAISMVDGGSILSDTSITVLSGNAPGGVSYPIIIKKGDVEAGAFPFLKVKVTTPEDVVTTKTFQVKMVDDESSTEEP